MLALEPDQGRWVVKTRRPPGTFWFDTMRQAACLDLAAMEAGIATPEPLIPPGRAVVTDASGPLAVVDELNDLINAELANEPDLLALHCDISLVNIMLTERGQMLLDFDHAGPQVPWWEVVGPDVRAATTALPFLLDDIDEWADWLS